MIFGNRHLLRLTVGRAGGRKDQIPGGAILHCAQKIQPAFDVGLVIEFGLLDGFTNESPSREMHHALDRIFSEGTIEIMRIADVAFKGGCSFDE